MNSEMLDYTILFLEDEDDTRKNYVKYLKRYFKNVFESNDGVKGYDIYREKKPDILIVDIHMPNMNGIDFLKKVRINDHSTKAIMLTSYSDKDYLLSAAQLKLTKYLIKPITREELKDALSLTIEEIKKFKTVSNVISNLPNGFLWDHQNKELYKDDHKIELTLQEKKVFELLIQNSNTILSYDDLIIHTWDNYEQDKLNALKMCIKKLRKKLPENIIQTVYAEGFKFVI